MMIGRLASLSAGAALTAFSTVGLAAPPLSGAIFTTTPDGEIVNENVRYNKKEDVYLDGGPGPNAPASAAGLPEDWYYFQVTDPSGKDLLSSDHISCRRIHVNEYGVIDEYDTTGLNYEYSNPDKMWVPVPCTGHNTNSDADHGGPPENAIVVQLFPYDDTPNNGGVYKAWITPVAAYAGDDNPIPPNADKKTPVNGENWQPGNVHGFIPGASKTDNYKVKEPGRPPAPLSELTLRKFHDANANCVFDDTESEITGWRVLVTDPVPTTNEFFTPDMTTLTLAGDWEVSEVPFDSDTPGTPDGVQQTSSFLDDVEDSCYFNGGADPTVMFSVGADELNEVDRDVLFGNVGLGSIEVCKYFDRDMDGEFDEGEPGIAGWKFELTGTTANGDAVSDTATSGEDGCATFDDLLPGEYTVTEVEADNYDRTGDLSADVTIESTLTENGEPTLVGNDEDVDFFNVCTNEADFGTKGYWHNKNGLQEIDPAFVNSYVNLLDPYDDPTSYFDDGDEPFDGEFADMSPVDPAFNDSGDPIWGGGTLQAEISHFLVDANAGGDPREQLAQQLLAFIFNVEYRLGGLDAVIVGYGTAGDLIDEAIAAWQSGTPEEQTAIKDILDALNNNDAVEYVPDMPCTPEFPEEPA